MIPMQEADNAITANRILLALYAVATLATVLGALYLLVHALILKPVQHLDTVARQIESGNYAIRSQVKTGDELERLGRSFNQMLSAIVRARSFEEAVLENVPSGVVTVDKVGRLKLFNRAASELFGLLSGDAIINLKRGLVQSDLGLLTDTLRTGQARLFEEMKLERRDGKVLTISVSTSPLTDEDGRLLGAVGVLTDLTELKVMDEQKGHLDRLAALGQLAGSIAHEINNPPQGILSGLGLVADPECDQAQRTLYTGVIREEVERIARIIQQMLDFYRPPREGRVLTDINVLVRNVLVLVGKQLQNSGIELTRS